MYVMGNKKPVPREGQVFYRPGGETGKHRGLSIPLCFYMGVLFYTFPIGAISGYSSPSVREIHRASSGDHPAWL